DRRDQPEGPDDDEGDVDRRRREEADDPRGHGLSGGARVGVELGLGGGHHPSLLKRRMFGSRTGRTGRDRKKARAEPNPGTFTPRNDTRHIASAITLASSWTEPGATESTMSNTLSTLMSMVTKTTVRTGASSGTVTRRNTCHSPAPSVRAASRTSRGIAASPAAITTIENPAQTQM